MISPIAFRLSLFYALFFALVGCIAPFWGLYLQWRGFDANEIGTLLAIFAGVRIFAPNLWAHWAGFFSSPVRMVQLAGLLTLIFFSLIWLVSSFWMIALVMVLYGFFWSAMLPQYELITMQAIENRVDEYSQIRLWGSIGFIVAVAGLGVVLEHWELNLLPMVMLALMLAIVINSLGFERFSTRSSTPDTRANLRAVIFTKPVIALLLANLLLQISHGPFYTFYSLYLDDRGYSSTEIGLLWALGVLVEVILFWKIQTLLKYLSIYQWFQLSLLLTGFRWLMVACIPDSGWVMSLAQLIHAFSFAMLHAVSIRYVASLFPGALQGKGQALYSSAGFGLGGATGAYLSGLAWDMVGGEMVFGLAAVVALVAMLVARPLTKA